MVPAETPLWAKCASQLIRLYHRWSPVQRGKYWLLRRSSSFLVAPVTPGLWVRATGVSGFEWKAFRGEPGERATADLFVRLLEPGMTVFDIGANIGYYSLLAARCVGVRGQVHAFEATPAVAERLADNVAINRLRNIRVNHYAVCDRCGEVEFRLQEDDSEGNSLVSYDPTWPVVRVPAVTLDEYALQQDIPRIHLLKIDVEGAESLVLSGARTILTGPTPPPLIIESNPCALRAAGGSPVALRGQLAEFGYQCYGIEQLTTGPEPVWNILAIHRTDDRRAVDLRRETLVPL